MGRTPRILQVVGVLGVLIALTVYVLSLGQPVYDIGVGQIAVGPAGVIVQYDAMVKEFTPDGTGERSWKVAADGPVVALAEGPTGRIDIVQRQPSRILVYSADGHLLDPSALRHAATALGAPKGAATSPGGDLYVVDAQDCRLVVFSPAGTWLHDISACGTAGSLIHGRLWIAPDGTIFLLGSAGVARFDASGRPLGLLRSSGAPVPGYGDGTGISGQGASDSEPESGQGRARILLLRLQAGRVDEYATDGRLIRRVSGLLPSSTELAGGADGRFYVASPGIGIAVYSDAGRYEGLLDGPKARSAAAGSPGAV